MLYLLIAMIQSLKTLEEIDDTIYPVYRETKGITSRWIYHTVLKCFERYPQNSSRPHPANDT